ncbi:AbrB/MazE/SpoVT family DNA-binding domain-containing protein [Candidatus Woesearchaeota archaeon]|nr:AbrB/MazE/SpoVT family DNA-binding domain-containing protein [Candidatus Woesearchaeota archaeon]
MVKRKVNKVGGNTFTISLPAKWVRLNEITPGDELDVDIDNNCVLIKRENYIKNKKEISVNLENLNSSSIKSIISVLYKSGYDKIEILFNSEEALETLVNTINNTLLGFEIVDQTERRCIVQNISAKDDSDFDQILRRSFLVSLTMAKNSYEYLKDGKFDKLNSLLSLELTNNRLTNFIHRCMNRNLNPDEKSHYLYVIIWNLENVADDYRDICMNYSKYTKKLSKETLKMYKEIVDLLDSYYKLYYNYSFSDFEKVKTNGKSLLVKMNKTMNQLHCEEIPILFYMNSIVRRINDFWGSTTGLNLDKIKD